MQRSTVLLRHLISHRPTKYLIAVCGPTASGKTGLAVEIARQYQTSVLSADARQVYREMKIGTAPPTARELSAVPHYLIGNKSIAEDYSAAAYARDALNVLESLYQENDFAVLCGGSGLYIQALLQGFDSIPAVSPEIRQQLQQRLLQNGLEALQQELMEADPAGYRQIEIQNPQRVLRALEVSLGTGRPYSAFLGKEPLERPFTPIKLAIEWPREALYARINQRCDAMLEAGLLKEVEALLPFRQHQALQTVGYKEFFDYFDSKYSFDEAVLKFKQHTRNYAKRQLTWFRKDKTMRWFGPEAWGKTVGC
ncbi:MAG: tRNA (adenosine(37)-N6)-dimethylallyltransferase MiaA [Bacteroidia bacterium]